MSSLTIRQFPDPLLRKLSAPIIKLDRSIASFVERLIELMRKQPGGIGIAAPQVGVMNPIAIVDVSSKVPGTRLHILINPVLIHVEDGKVFREGCMSLPDFTANVKRADRVTVKFMDLKGKMQELAAEGLEARCIQHEVDHLRGILFVDRVVSLRSDVFRRKKYL